MLVEPLALGGPLLTHRRDLAVQERRVPACAPVQIRKRLAPRRRLSEGDHQRMIGVARRLGSRTHEAARLDAIPALFALARDADRLLRPAHRAPRPQPTQLSLRVLGQIVDVRRLRDRPQPRRVLAIVDPVFGRRRQLGGRRGRCGRRRGARLRWRRLGGWRDRDGRRGHGRCARRLVARARGDEQQRNERTQRRHGCRPLLHLRRGGKRCAPESRVVATKGRVAASAGLCSLLFKASHACVDRSSRPR